MKTWFTEDQTPNMRLGLRVKSILHHEKSAYQEITVFDTYSHGRLLTLDDIVMTTEKDEFVYHEMISHVPLVTHPNPKKTLIVGGGDGGAIRETLKHPSVEEAHIAEIDGRVMEVSKKYLPTIAAELDNPRTRVHVTDGIEFVAEHPGEFDVIMVDSTDPIGPAVGLFSGDFYRSVYRALTDDGLFVAQTESPFYNRDLLQRIQQTLADIFPIVRLYWGVVPTYPGGFWTFSLGSKRHDPLEADLARAAGLETRYYSAEVHKAAFVLPPFVAELAARPDAQQGVVATGTSGAAGSAQTLDARDDRGETR